MKNKLPISIRDFYLSKEYSNIIKRYKRVDFYKNRFNLINKVIKKYNILIKGKVLDVGCGDGKLLKEFITIYPMVKYYGVDISPTACKISKNFNIITTCFDISKGLPYKSNQFNIVVSEQVIEHLYNPDLLLIEAHRILKKDGILIILTPNLLAWYQRIFCLFGYVPTFYELSTVNRQIGQGFLKKILKKTDPVGHIRVFTSKALKDICELHKFKTIELSGISIDYNFKFPFNIIFQLIDNFFARFSSLSSNLLIIVKKN